MSYNVITTVTFGKELKQLSKKYPSLRKEYSDLIGSLEQNPSQGVSLGRSCYKIRIAISSKRKGKSGGGRVITYVYVTGRLVYLLSIYDKSEKETISDSELRLLLRAIV